MAEPIKSPIQLEDLVQIPNQIKELDVMDDRFAQKVQVIATVSSALSVARKYKLPEHEAMEAFTEEYNKVMKEAALHLKNEMKRRIDGM